MKNHYHHHHHHHREVLLLLPRETENQNCYRRRRRRRRYTTRTSWMVSFAFALLIFATSIIGHHGTLASISEDATETNKEKEEEEAVQQQQQDSEDPSVHPSYYRGDDKVEEEEEEDDQDGMATSLLLSDESDVASPKNVEDEASEEFEEEEEEEEERTDDQQQQEEEEADNEDADANGNENNNNDELNYFIINDFRTLDQLLTTYSNRSTTKKKNADDTTKTTSTPPRSLLLVAFIYKETDCPASTEQLGLFRQVVSSFFDSDSDNNNNNTVTNSSEPSSYLSSSLDVKFCEITVRPETLPLLDQLGVTHVPTIRLLKQQLQKPPQMAVADDNDNDINEVLLYASNYIGAQSSVQELQNGLMHYLSRFEHSHWQYNPHPARRGTEYLDGTLTLRVNSLDQLQNIVRQGNILQSSSSSSSSAPVVSPPATPLDPRLSIEEREWIRYLLREGEEEVHSERLLVSCHCRDPDGYKERQKQKLASEFDTLATVLSLRRNMAFCVLQLEKEETEKCPFEIRTFEVDPEDLSLRLHSGYDSTLLVNPLHQPASLEEYYSKMLRPALMWLDRQTTAPIAFAPYYKVHAVLFVDFHSPDTKEDMRDAVDEFRRQCQLYFRRPMVCLVVPSTETRVLTTFGIDIWSRLDQEFLFTTSSNNGSNINEAGTDSSSSSSSNAIAVETLPTLLVTDAREGVGIRRYYLDPPLLTKKDNYKSMMGQFLEDFWQGKLQPEIKSADQHHEDDMQGDGDTTTTTTIAKNAYNVHLVTADTLHSFIDSSNTNGSKEKMHTLLMLYAPTCGHCKRLNLAWNALGELIEFIEWQDKLQIGRMDVSANEFFFPDMATVWLPEVFYFDPSPSSSADGTTNTVSPVRFYNEDLEVGAISDPLDIIDWLLDIVEAADNYDDDMNLTVLLEALEATKY